MKKLKISVDLDGVIWDIMGTFVNIYNEMYGENLKPEDIDKWYYFPEDRWSTVYPLTLPRIMEYPILNAYIPTYLFFLNKVYDISILTKEQNEIPILKYKLETLGIEKGREYNELIRLDIEDSKLNYPFDIYIDDNPTMIEKMKDYPKKLLLLYDQPVNKKADILVPGNILRVKGWEEVISFIRTIEILARDNDTIFC